MIALDEKYDQRIFYHLNKSLTPAQASHIFQFPFTLSNVSDKRLDKISVIFEFSHLRKGFISDPPAFSDSELGFVLNLSTTTTDITGRKTLERTTTELLEKASVAYNLSELLPREEAAFEFHFKPTIYPVQVIPQGASVDIAAYLVVVRVISETVSARHTFKLFILPADTELDFLEGANGFARYLNCLEVCAKTWYEKLVHRSEYLAARYSKRFEDVYIRPMPFLVEEIGPNTYAQRVSSGTSVKKYSITLGGSPG